MKIQKKTGLRVFDVAFIRSLKPCYNPNKFLKEDWRGTVVDVLKLEDVPAQDRLWVVLRTTLISERVMRLFAVWTYRQTLVFLPNQDPRCIKAADVAEAYANGLATEEELDTSNRAALSANAAASAASAAASAAAYYAAYSAFTVFGSALSINAALSANAAASAAYCAHYVPTLTEAAEAAEKKARDGQVEKLIEMCIAEGKERLVLRKGRKK